MNTQGNVQLAEALPPPAEEVKVRGRSIRLSKLSFWIFVGPLVLGLLIFTYIPIIWGVILSVFNAQYTVTPTQFVGLQNYVAMLTDPPFLQSLGTFALFALFIVPITFILSMGLAVLINNVPVGKAFFRSVYFLPTACSMVVASLIWRTAIFSGLGSSTANMLVHLFGVSPINWIGTTSPPWYWLVLVTVRLWNGLGFNIILFLAALQEIPTTLYEAARIDGARRGWSTFRHITFPLLNNVSMLVLLLNLISAFQAFDEFYNVLGYGSSGGGYSALVRPPLIYLFQIGFSSGDYGKGSAGAFILTAIIIGITIIQGRFLGFGRSEE